MKASLSAAEDKDFIPKFNAEETGKAHLVGLKYWEKKMHHSAIEDYIKFSQII